MHSLATKMFFVFKCEFLTIALLLVCDEWSLISAYVIFKCCECAWTQISGLNLVFVCRTSCCSAMTATEATTCTVSVLPWLNRQRVSWHPPTTPLLPSSDYLYYLELCAVETLGVSLFHMLWLHHVTRLRITHHIFYAVLVWSDIYYVDCFPLFVH